MPERHAREPLTERQSAFGDKRDTASRHAKSASTQIRPSETSDRHFPTATDELDAPLGGD